jgi:hypothetical protein
MFAGVAMFAGSVVRQPASAEPNGPVPPTPNPSPAPTPAPAPAPASPDGQILPDSSSRDLTPGEIAGLTAAQLRIARNEIYARHGYIFESPDLRDHFAAFSWYHPSRTTVAFSPVETRNIARLKAAESRTAASG